MAVVATAGSTATGSFDDLEAIGRAVRRARRSGCTWTARTARPRCCRPAHRFRRAGDRARALDRLGSAQDDADAARGGRAARARRAGPGRRPSRSTRRTCFTARAAPRPGTRERAAFSARAAWTRSRCGWRCSATARTASARSTTTCARWRGPARRGRGAARLRGPPRAGVATSSASGTSATGRSTTRRSTTSIASCASAYNRSGRGLDHHHGARRPPVPARDGDEPAHHAGRHGAHARPARGDGRAALLRG